MTKRKDVLDGGGPIKKVTGFVYEPGSICAIERDPTPDEREVLVTKGICLKCLKPYEELNSNPGFCGNCGLPRQKTQEVDE